MEREQFSKEGRNNAFDLFFLHQSIIREAWPANLDADMSS
jgi:hypothetical protein